jgi:hypothetical protein
MVLFLLPPLLVLTVVMFERTFLVAAYDTVFAMGSTGGAVDRCDGGDRHGHHAGLAIAGAALRQSDTDRGAVQAYITTGSRFTRYHVKRKSIYEP